MERNKSLTEKIQDKMYERRMREIKVLGGKSREYWIIKANTRKPSWKNDRYRVL